MESQPQNPEFRNNPDNSPMHTDRNLQVIAFNGSLMKSGNVVTHTDTIILNTVTMTAIAKFHKKPHNKSTSTCLRVTRAKR